MYRVECRNCGKRLKYDDGQAGKTAKCPGCHTGLTLPAVPAAPAEPTPLPPPPVPVPVPPPPMPVPAPYPGYGAPPAPVRVVPWTANLYPPPPPAGGQPFEFDDPDPPRGGYDDDRAPARRRPRWHAEFGLGCGLVKWGMWVNFAASAYVVLLLEVTLLGVALRSKNLVVIDTVGLYVPLFLLQLAGTGLMLAGWWRMTAAPPISGAGGLLTGAAALAGLRELVLVVGTGFLLLAAVVKGIESLKYLANAYAALVLGNVCIWVATFSVIPGVAIVGGELPSRRLRQKAGQITFVHQILVITLLALVAVLYFTVSASELVSALPTGGGDGGDDPLPVPRGGRGGGRAPRAGDAHPEVYAMFFLMVVLAVEAAYTYLHYSLYSVGQDAAGRGGDSR